MLVPALSTCAPPFHKRPIALSVSRGRNIFLHLDWPVGRGGCGQELGKYSYTSIATIGGSDTCNTKALFIQDPAEAALDAICKRVTVADCSDRRLMISHWGTPLSYRTFDKNRKVNAADTFKALRTPLPWPANPLQSHCFAIDPLRPS